MKFVRYIEYVWMLCKVICYNKHMRTLLLFIIIFSLYFQAFGQKTVYYKTTKKHKLYYIEISGEIAKVYKMGVYFDKAGSGSAIIKLDTLINNIENEFIGKTYSLFKENDNFILKTENSKKFNTEIVEDKTAYRTLNNAYFLKSYFDLSDSLNYKFPLNHYSFRNGYYAWNKLSNKDFNLEEFKKYTDLETQTIYDSIFNIQTRLTKTTNFITENVREASYSVLKDSISTLPITYRPQSGYFDKSVYQISKANPEYFYKLLQDFPASKNFIYSAIEKDNELVKQLKQVQGYDSLKKEFIKDYKYGKSMPYRVIGLYVVVGGLLAWLIISQP